MSIRNKIIITAAIALVLLGTIMVMLSGDKPAETPAWGLGEISRGTLMAEVAATGTLSPVITVQVGSQVSGRRLLE